MSSRKSPPEFPTFRYGVGVTEFNVPLVGLINDEMTELCEYISWRKSADLGFPLFLYFIFVLTFTLKST